MISWLLARQIMGLFVMMAGGWLLVKSGVAKSEDSRVLSVISVYLAVPCSLLNSFQIDITPDIADGLKLALIGAVIAHAVIFAVTYALAKIFRLTSIEIASTIYSNAVNLVIPLVSTVLGEQWVIYTSAFMCLANITMWTHGSSLVRGERDFDLKKILRNVNMIAVFFGLFMLASGFRFPPLIGGSMRAIGSMLGPNSMILLGMIFARVNFRKVFSDPRVYFVVFLKMLVVPSAVVAVLKWSPLAGMAKDGPTILLIVLLATIGPSATMITQMAQLYGRDPEYASSINILTTLVCIVTMPVTVMLYQM